MAENSQQNKELVPEPKPDTKKRNNKGAYTIPVQMV
jgi:hypothetical protein